MAEPQAPSHRNFPVLFTVRAKRLKFFPPSYSATVPGFSLSASLVSYPTLSRQMLEPLLHLPFFVFLLIHDPLDTSDSTARFNQTKVDPVIWKKTASLNLRPGGKERRPMAQKRRRLEGESRKTGTPAVLASTLNSDPRSLISIPPSTDSYVQDQGHF